MSIATANAKIDIRKFYGEGSLTTDAIFCRKFGCVEILTLWQTLLSDYCPSHQRVEDTNLNFENIPVATEEANLPVTIALETNQ